MDESLGYKLQQARTARGLSVEDVARATKIRPGRVLDLERDVYDNFPHISYARNFVVLYGRYLGVDVKPYLSDFDTSRALEVDDYQYLKETTPVAQVRRPTRRRRAPLVAAAGFVVAGLIALFSWFVWISVQRLGDIDVLTERQSRPRSGAEEEVDSTVPKSAASTNTPSPEELLASAESTARIQPPRAETTFVANALSIPPAAVSTPPQPQPRLGIPADGQPPAPALPATAYLSIPDAPRAVPIQPGSSEVVLRPLRETWVTITLNDPDSNPVYDDFLKPGDHSLRFTGKRFWVFVHDRDSVEIRKNDQLVVQTASDVYIE